MSINTDARVCRSTLAFLCLMPVCLFLLLAPISAAASRAQAQHLRVTGKWLSLAASLGADTRGMALTANANHWLVLEFPANSCDSPVISVIEMEDHAIDVAPRGTTYVQVRVDANPAINGLAILRALKDNKLFAYLAFEKKPADERLITQMRRGKQLRLMFYVPFAKSFHLVFSLQGSGRAISHAMALCESSG